MTWVTLCLIALIVWKDLKETYNNNRVQKQLVENLHLLHQQNQIMFERVQLTNQTDQNLKQLLGATTSPLNNSSRRFGGRSDEEEAKIAKMKEQANNG